MLVKAQFQRLDNSFNEAASVDVRFNPTEFTLNKGVQIADIGIPGLDAPILQFVRGQTETLTLDLFFDSTEGGTGDDAIAVTERTDLFYQLLKIDKDTHAPPICRFVWGKKGFPGSQMDDKWASQNRVHGFQCIVESVRQRFTLFNPQGVPLRATLTVTLREYKTLEQQIKEIGFHSRDHTHAHVVQLNDTLSRIAFEAYGDPQLWRSIAEKNGIVDPLDLSPGMILEIPPLR